MSNSKQQEIPVRPIAQSLQEAKRNGAALDPVTSSYPSITIDDAYAVQMDVLDECLGIGGQRLIGRKIGVTSNAVMQSLKVAEPAFGFLTSDMIEPDGAAIPTDMLIAPKVGGQLAFLLREGLDDTEVTASDVLQATELVMPCIEIVDSRIRDGGIRIEDVIADNVSSAHFVLGGIAREPESLALDLVGMTLEINGAIIATGAGAASMRHPAEAVAWLANSVVRRGRPLSAGEIILSGALGPMASIVAGDNVHISIGGLGSAGVRFI